MNIQFGLETEYGISREGGGVVDVVAESIALVRSAPAAGVRLRWDYSCENPHRDARGFTVLELRQDTDEAGYESLDEARPLSFREIKSDFALLNGARFYNDHAHPEYCTPECSTLLELLQQDCAGDQLLMACAGKLSGESGNHSLLYKNNTDFQGHSYGCHENYLLSRELPWQELSRGILAFLVTRQIFAGAGKYGWEDEDRFLKPGFQISQRSDFFSVLQSVDTMQRRPLINTRDEPHADAKKYRRLHVILGDANLSPFATYLKVGTTALVLNALLQGAPSQELPWVSEPVQTLKDISRDPSFTWELREEGGRRTNAIEVQRRYFEIARKYCPQPPGEWEDLLHAWAEVLDDLGKDPLRAADRLDWVAKYRLIENFREVEKVSPDDPWLRSLDLAYHRMDRDEGLFWGLAGDGGLRTPFPVESIKGFGLRPPCSTRAAIRGFCIEKFGKFVEETQWEHLILRDGEERIHLDLGDLFDAAEVARSLEVVKAAENIGDLMALPFAMKKNICTV
ncbi:MAG: proteasome accessory factor PafA2 family protein [Opitutales bacterium]